MYLGSDVEEFTERDYYSDEIVKIGDMLSNKYIKWWADGYNVCYFYVSSVYGMKDSKCFYILGDTFRFYTDNNGKYTDSYWESCYSMGIPIPKKSLSGESIYHLEIIAKEEYLKALNDFLEHTKSQFI